MMLLRRLLPTLAIACLAACGDAREEGNSGEDITTIPQSPVKRQSIGNCWVYATVAWIESLHIAAKGKQLNVSESWLTYWHWFDQITTGAATKEVPTGGDFSTAAGVIGRYGLVMEGDFLPREADDEMSERQKAAEVAINKALSSGALASEAARTDRALVRRELDRAFGLDAKRIKRINTVFGETVERTLDSSYDAFVAAADNKIVSSMDLEAKLKDPTTGAFVNGSIAEALGLGGATRAWSTVPYPTVATERRAYWQRIQRALHDRQPVLLAWTVDFNALRKDSRFSKAEVDRLGPGSQGGHLTVIHDYQAEVPGIGLLEAGRQATTAQMEAALDVDTKIEFVRVKNSWGGIRPERWTSAAVPGYHDLELEYLDGPIKTCETNASGQPNPARCRGEVVPLTHVVLPAGY